MNPLSSVLEQQTIVVSNNDVAFVRHRSADGQTWIFGGRVSQRQSVMREVGKEAANLESAFSWHDAACVTAAMRQAWPDSAACQCECDLGQNPSRNKDAVGGWVAEVMRRVTAALKALGGEHDQ